MSLIDKPITRLIRTIDIIIVKKRKTSLVHQVVSPPSTISLYSNSPSSIVITFTKLSTGSLEENKKHQLFQLYLLEYVCMWKKYVKCQGKGKNFNDIGKEKFHDSSGNF